MKKQILRVFIVLALFTALPGCGSRQAQNAFADTTSSTAAVETTAAETNAAETTIAGEAKEKMLRMKIGDTAVAVAADDDWRGVFHFQPATHHSVIKIEAINELQYEGGDEDYAEAALYKKLNALLNDVRTDPSDPFDALIGNSVPCLAISLISYLIEQFKSQSVPVLSESLGKLLPETVESFLIVFPVKETFLILSGIKAVSVGLVQIKNDIQSILKSPVKSPVQVGKAAFLIISLIILNQVVVNRDPDVIQTPFTDRPEVFLPDEVIICFHTVIAL